MFLFVCFTIFSMATSFTATRQQPRAGHATAHITALKATMNRRDAFAAAVMGLIALPELSNAKPASTFFFEDNLVNEPSQMPTAGKTDLNSAFVVGEHTT
jgi:hypothetical protein